MRALLILIGLLLAAPAYAADLQLNADGTLAQPIPLLIVDSSGTAFTGQTLADVDLYYSCGTTSYQFNETGDTLTELSATLRPGEYEWTSNDVIGTNCAAPKVLTVSGGGTDRDVVATLFGLRRAEVTGTVVSSADCTNSATTFDTTLPSAYSGTNGPREAGLRFTSGALINEVRRIGGYNTNGCVSVNQAFSGTPAAGDAFVVVNQ